MERKTPQDTESRHADKYIVRFPEGMRDKLKAEAKVNNRTLNAEVVARLERSFSTTDMGLQGDALDHLGLMSMMLSMLLMLNDKFQGKTREEVEALARSATANINSKLALGKGLNTMVLNKDSSPPSEADEPDRPVTKTHKTKRT